MRYLLLILLCGCASNQPFQDSKKKSAYEVRDLLWFGGVITTGESPFMDTHYSLISHEWMARFHGGSMEPNHSYEARDCDKIALNDKDELNRLNTYLLSPPAFFIVTSTLWNGEHHAYCVWICTEGDVHTWDRTRTLTADPNENLRTGRIRDITPLLL